MNRFLSLMMCFVLATAPALAQVKDVTPGIYTPGFSSFANYIKNTDCFANAKASDFSKSASGDVTRTTSSPVQGSASCSVSGSATADKVKFLTNTFDSALYGQACEARFTYKGDGSKWKAYVEQGSGKVSPDTTLINTGSNSSIVSINFACGDGSNSTSLVLEATASTPATIKVGATYAGLATNIQSGAIVTTPTAYSPTWTGLGTVTENNLWHMQVGANLIVWGTVKAGTPTTNGLTFTLPGGYTLDTSRFPSGTIRTHSFGTARRLTNTGVALTNGGGSVTVELAVVYTGSTSAVQLVYNTNGSQAFADSNASDFTSIGDRINLEPTTFPIAQGTASFIRPTQTSLQPAGEIMTFAGATCPTGWLAADGSAISRTDYGQMFARMGVAHGSGNGTTTFNLPDYRGRFLRGVAGGSANDPDRASRTAMATGGNTGDNVGSVQTDVLGSHSHNYDSGPNSFFLLRTTGGAVGLTSGTAATVTASATQSTGGNETRPKNAYVTYCVRAYDQVSQAPIMVGNVITGSTVLERQERAIISVSNSAAAVTSQSGSTFSVANGASAGRTTVTMTGFSATPTCVCSHTESLKACSANVTSATNIDLRSWNGLSNAEENGVVHLHCMGPR